MAAAESIALRIRAGTAAEWPSAAGSAAGPLPVRQRDPVADAAALISMQTVARSAASLLQREGVCTVSDSVQPALS